MLQLREVRKRYATVRGAAAILAGYWTEGVGVMLLNEGGIQMVLVATDEEVYGTLQPYLDAFLGDSTFILDARQMRQRYPRPQDLARFMRHLQLTNQLMPLAASWLTFPRVPGMSGGDLITQALDRLIAPLPATPTVVRFDLALQLDTGNTLYAEINDLESLLSFIYTYYQNADAILKQITPRPRASADDDSTTP